MEQHGGDITASRTFALDLNTLTAAAVDVSADSIAIIDANDSNASKKESSSPTWQQQWLVPLIHN